MRLFYSNKSNFDLVGYADAEYYKARDLKQVICLHVEELLYLGDR